MRLLQNEMFVFYFVYPDSPDLIVFSTHNCYNFNIQSKYVWWYRVAMSASMLYCKTTELSVHSPLPLTLCFIKSISTSTRYFPKPKAVRALNMNRQSRESDTFSKSRHGSNPFYFIYYYFFVFFCVGIQIVYEVMNQPNVITYVC